MSGIYIHIPFCKKACHYCDFHFSTNTRYIDRMINAICKEIELKKNYLPDNTLINTIYFGGGTPSLLSDVQLNTILLTIMQHFNLSADTEVTLEANPDDLNLDKLIKLKNTGINRLSIGIQSFDNEVLQWMNRSHTAEQSVNAVKTAQQVGFDNISIDLIYSIPAKDINYWTKTLDTAIQLNVSHISAYCLTIEENTTFYHDLKKGKITPVPDELAAEQFIKLHEMLSNAHYIHYEVSNFGRENYFSKHNTSYWKDIPYLGIGPSAHSYNKHNRSVNIAHNLQYLKQIENNENFTKTEILNPIAKHNDYILTRLRTIWGLNKNDIAYNFGLEKLTRIENIINSKYKEYFESTKDKFVLNLQGMLFTDKITLDLML